MSAEPVSEPSCSTLIARGSLLPSHLSTTHNLAIFLDFMPVSAFALPVESRLSTEIVVQCFSYSASISRNSSARPPKDFMYLGHHGPMYSGTATATKVVASPLQVARG